MPVAVNCCVCPTTTEPLTGVTAMEVSCAGVTFSVTDPVILPLLPLMVLEPAATAVATPPELIVAAARLSEAQVTVEVMSELLPSEKLPVAENCT